MGLVLAPHRMARAWALGRHTHNLYGEDGVEHLLPRKVSDVRAGLGLAAPKRPRTRLRDALAVVVVGLPALAVMLSPLVGVALLVRWLAF
jgi:hypothetical protein